MFSSRICVDVVLEDFTRTDIRDLTQFLNIFKMYGVRMITLADTVGSSTPTEYGNNFKYLINEYPTLDFAAHCHNDMGLASANTLAAVENGAKQVEVTFLGIGERAGNTPIEEIITILNKKERFEAPLDIISIYKVSKKIAKLVNFEITKNKPIIGENMFLHESGIHQDGIYKNEEMYQYILPTDLGLNEDESIKLPISSLSSKKVLINEFKNMIKDEEIEEIINFYKILNKYANDILPEESVDIYKILKRMSLY